MGNDQGDPGEGAAGTVAPRSTSRALIAGGSVVVVVAVIVTVVVLGGDDGDLVVSEPTATDTTTVPPTAATTPDDPASSPEVTEQPVTTTSTDPTTDPTTLPPPTTIAPTTTMQRVTLPPDSSTTAPSTSLAPTTTPPTTPPPSASTSTPPTSTTRPTTSPPTTTTTPVGTGGAGGVTGGASTTVGSWALAGVTPAGIQEQIASWAGGGIFGGEYVPPPDGSFCYQQWWYDHGTEPNPPVRPFVFVGAVTGDRSPPHRFGFCVGGLFGAGVRATISLDGAVVATMSGTATPEGFGWIPWFDLPDGLGFGAGSARIENLNGSVIAVYDFRFVPTDPAQLLPITLYPIDPPPFSRTLTFVGPPDVTTPLLLYTVATGTGFPSLVGYLGDVTFDVAGVATAPFAVPADVAPGGYCLVLGLNLQLENPCRAGRGSFIIER